LFRTFGARVVFFPHPGLTAGLTHWRPFRPDASANAINFRRRLKTAGDGIPRDAASRRFTSAPIVASYARKRAHRHLNHQGDETTNTIFCQE
jgi:hypothetical protein